MPTEKGYRVFVDQIAALKPLSSAERSAISRFLDGAVDLDDIMLRTTRLLGRIGHTLESQAGGEALAPERKLLERAVADTILVKLAEE